MIKLDITEEELLDENRVLEISNCIFLTKRLCLDGKSSYDDKLKKCFNFYNGVEPLTVFKKGNEFKPRVVNLTKPLVDTATQTFIGDLPNIVSTGKKAEKDKISKLNERLYNIDFGTHINEVEHYSSKCGTGLLCLYADIGDNFPRVKEINPLYADCVYDCSLEQKHLMSYYIVEINKPTSASARATIVMYVYTKKRVYAFKSVSTRVSQATTPNAEMKPLVPFYAWTFYNDNKKNELNFVEHNFEDIPLIEFPNNAERLGDAESAFDLISFYNDIMNNRGKNLHDVVNYLLYLKNARIGNEEERKAFLSLLENNKVLAVEGEDVDARFLSNQLNQDQLQTLQDNIKDTIHYITRIPDLSSTDFSQNASDPIIKIKTKPLLDLCKQKEKYFTKPYFRLLKMILAWCRKNDENFETYNVDLSLCSLRYTHTLPSNDSDMITMITNLSNSGLANPEVLLEELSFVPNVYEYMKGVIKHNEYIDKRKQETKNIIKQGTNETNLQRQNSEPLTKAKMDNKSNFDRGNANTLSEEKV